MNHANRNNLFLILFDAFTVVVWVWLVATFLMKGKFDMPEFVSTLYLLILAFYVGDKEIRRHRKKYSSHFRKGEYFVYLWGLTLVVIVGFYAWGGNNRGFVIPRELPTVAGTVLVLYIVTEFLKKGSGDT
jgi:hypothetical protein